MKISLWAIATFNQLSNYEEFFIKIIPIITVNMAKKSIMFNFHKPLL
ncbi:MAG: hypothetical protein MK289_01825 [Trichodesmium sp. ALOHA_ZT_67]|nr:hypothetical protein [Trichodesmium sp. ALOHA_ZT_67]